MKVYSGEQGIRDYLRPDVDDYSPLVELCSDINPYLKSHDIHIYVKLLNTLPLSNVKSLPAWSMLDHARESLEGKTIVESSSGNTVLSLGLLAKSFGIRRVKAVASRDVTPGKLSLLRIAGIDVQLVDGPLCPRPDDPKSSISIARLQGKQSGWYNPSQYDNDANPQAHRDYTGPQLFRQLDGNIALFVAGLGTTGTFVGTAEYLRSRIDGVQTVGVVRAPNNPVPGVRTKNLLREVAFPWRNATTSSLITVNERDAYEKSLLMIRHGLLVGPSAGFALAGVIKHLGEMAVQERIESMRGKNVVFIAPDSMFPYVDEYFDVLEPTSFGEIDDQTTFQYTEASSELAKVAELTVDDIYSDYVDVDGQLVSRHYQLIDIRDEHSYQDHHLPDSIHIPMFTVESWLRQHTTIKQIVFICDRGAQSLRAAQMATGQGIRAYSMIGGTVEWSARGLPRILSQHC